MENNEQFSATRNRQLFLDRCNGLTYKMLGTKYNISVERARQVFAQEMKRINRLDDDEMLSLLFTAASVLSVNTTNATRAETVLRRYGIDTPQKLLSVRLQDFIKWRNAGVNNLAILAVAQELARESEEEC